MLKPRRDALVQRQVLLLTLLRRRCWPLTLYSWQGEALICRGKYIFFIADLCENVIHPLWLCSKTNLLYILVKTKICIFHKICRQLLFFRVKNMESSAIGSRAPPLWHHTPPWACQHSDPTEGARIGWHVIVACVIIWLQQKQSGDGESDSWRPDSGGPAPLSVQRRWEQELW